MTYEQRGTWVYLLVVLGTYGVYLGIVLSQLGTTAAGDIDYVGPLLWSIGISIGAAIVLRILVELLTPKASQRTDDRDRDIARTSERLGVWPLVAGALGALILAILRADHFWIANAIYLGFAAQAVLTSIIRLALYRRGF